MLSFSTQSLLVLSISSFLLTVQASSGHGNVRLNHRSKSVTLRARDTSGVFTWYIAGLGACGTTNTASDYIVALNSAQWDNGAHCYKSVLLNYGGRTVTAQVTDQCPTCDYGQLDLTHDLFANLAGGDPNQIGQVSGSWSFADEAPPPSSTTTHTHSTSTTETPTSTPTPSSSSSSSSSTSSWTSSSSMSSSSSSSSVSTTSTSSTSSTSSATPSATPSGLFVDIHQVLIQLGEIAAIAYLENSSS